MKSNHAWVKKQKDARLRRKMDKAAKKKVD